MTLTDFNGKRGQAIGQAARAWEEMGRILTRSVIDDITYYIDRGISSDLIIKAIDITIDKRADWRYTRAILRRCLEEKVYTVRDFEFKTLFKKGLITAQREGINVLDDFAFSLYLAATVFKEHIVDIQRDFEMYLLAVENGDTSEWDEKWERVSDTFSSVNSEE